MIMVPLRRQQQLNLREWPGSKKKKNKDKNPKDSHLKKRRLTDWLKSLLILLLSRNDWLLRKLSMLGFKRKNKKLSQLELRLKLKQKDLRTSLRLLKNKLESRKKQKSKLIERLRRLR